MIVEGLLFIFFWLTMCGLWHESMHLLEVDRQGSTSSYMWFVYKPFPGMRFSAGTGITNMDLVLLAGGIYTAILCFALSFITLSVSHYLGWLFLTLGMTQLAYGYFEYAYIRKLSSKMYTVGRVIIYISIPIVMYLLLYPG